MSVLLGLLMIHPRPVCAGFQAWGQALFRLYLPWLQILRLKPGPGGWSLGLHRGGGGRAGRHTPASPRAPSPSLLHKAQVRAVLKESEKLRLAEDWGAWGPWASYCLGRFWGLGSHTGGSSSLVSLEDMELLFSYPTMRV